MKPSKWRFLKNKWLWSAVVLILIIVAYAYFKNKNKAPSFEVTKATISTVVDKVNVTGMISPVTRSDLSFKKGGVIAKVFVKVGDNVRRGQPIASLDSASDEAALRSMQATLADTSRSLTPQELVVQQTALQNAEEDAVNAVHDGFAKTQSALFNYTDSFFLNAQSVNPTISVRTDGVLNQIAMNKKRLDVTHALDLWTLDISAAPALKPSELVLRTRGHLAVIKDFMTSLSVIVNSLNTANSGLSQAAINANIATMNTGLTNLNAVISSVAQSETALAAAESNYNLKLSGNSSQAIAAQAARVAEAQTQVNADTIFSPIDGVITKADPNVGEYISPGQSGFTVQNSNFKIEARVPEADIAKISIGDMASTTLDAYGSGVDFPSQVISVDPAETVLEGVPTYKVTLMFTTSDSRIRSGMTANLEILTSEKPGVLAVPYRAILIDQYGAKTVRKLNADGRTWSSVAVTTGLKGSDGTTEITSGLNEGDTVVTYVR